MIGVAGCMDAAALRDDFFRQFSRYWPQGEATVRGLPLHLADMPAREPLPPALAWVRLPEWALDLGSGDDHQGCLPLPEHLIGPSGDWRAADWPLCGAWFLHCLAERAHERIHGPIHSYSSRLPGWDAALWSRAWANRMALFLCRWAARETQGDAKLLLGPLPESEILLTHDLDAVRKTVPIRCKQTAFQLFNALREARRGCGRRMVARLAAALRFFFSPGRDWDFMTVAGLDAAHGLRALFLISGNRPPSPAAVRRWLFDPGYEPEDIRSPVETLKAAGYGLGLHPGTGSWNDAGDLARQRGRLEQLYGTPVTACRQHWLRFSFADTWTAQAEAGIRLDCTLGFNDRPGFRNGAALAHSPLFPKGGRWPDFRAWPLVLMDSHLYDYRTFTPQEREAAIQDLVSEVRFVRGQATVLWHPHTLSRDYGWRPGFEHLLAQLASGRRHGGRGAAHCPE